MHDTFDVLVLVDDDDRGDLALLEDVEHLRGEDPSSDGHRVSSS